MFRHLVLYRVPNPADAAEMKRRFETMPEKIPQIVTLESGLDDLHSPRSFDVSLVMTFRNREDYLAYKDHPYHRQFVMPFVHSVTEQAVSADYEVK